jgi:hypothetical protein
MNLEENIEYLAQANSGSCYPKRSVEDIDKRLPYFNISKANDKYKIEMFNYGNHDNAPRMPYVMNYLGTRVLPFVKGDLTGFYNIQLHDTYTYLNDGLDYKDVLCFGKLKGDKGPVQIPDCYMLGDWGGKYRGWFDGSVKDSMEWSDKMNKIVFAGTTTGSRDPKINERIQTCVWARDKAECDFYITSIAQIEPRHILQEVPEFKYIYRPPIPMSEQMKYRYQLVIDGNTTRWNPDVYFTKTLAFHWPSKDMLWYSPLLKDGFEYVGVDKDTLMNNYNYYQSNPREANVMIANANKMAWSVFKEEVCQKYMIALFENIANNK